MRRPVAEVRFHSVHVAHTETLLCLALFTSAARVSAGREYSLFFVSSQMLSLDRMRYARIV